jgi:hypothetical protein
LQYTPLVQANLHHRKNKIPRPGHSATGKQPAEQGRRVTHAALTVEETAATLEQLSGPLTFMLGFLAKPDVLNGTQTTLRVETTDPNRVLGLVLGESVSLVDAPTDVSGVLSIPAEALLRLLAGRLDEAHTPDIVTITSSFVTLEELRKVFPGI